MRDCRTECRSAESGELSAFGLALTLADVAALEPRRADAAKARRKSNGTAKPDPVEAAAGAGGGVSDAPGPGRSARAAGQAASTSHGSGVTAGTSVVLGRLAQPDALTAAKVGVRYPSGDLYSSWPAFAG